MNSQNSQAADLWDCEAAALRIINPDDLLVGKRRKQLEIRTNPLLVPTSDGEEIVRRQALLRYAMEREWLLNWGQYEAPAPGGELLPQRTQAFLDHFPEVDVKGRCVSRFMMRLERLIKGVERDREHGSVPEALDAFCTEVHGLLPSIRDAEHELYKAVGDEVAHAVELQGTVRITSPKHGSKAVVVDEVIGHAKFVHDRFTDRMWSLPRWADGRLGWLRHLAFPVRLAVQAQNNYWRKREYGPLVITRLPREIKEALTAFVAGAFLETSVQVELFFTFHDGQLKAHLTGYEALEDIGYLAQYQREEEESKRRWAAGNLTPDGFPGYGARHLRRISRMRTRLIKQGLRRRDAAAQRLQILREIQQAFGSDATVEIGCGADFAHLRDRSLADLRNEQTDLEARCAEIEAFRAWIAAHVAIIRDACQIASAYLRKCHEWQLPLTFPEVLDDSVHTVSFARLMPIHLIGRSHADGKRIKTSDLIAIDGLPELNGQMVSLTALNIGGKTVTLEELASVIYDAHCGLPVFADRFAFNPKEALGLAFLERGEGSTAELLNIKAAAVLRAAREFPEHRFLVILDEVGTGTWERVGYELGFRILQKLQKSGCSVLFSTQIPGLAKDAETDLGALPFQILESDRRIVPGIGYGDVGHLATHAGLEELLADDTP